MWLPSSAPLATQQSSNCPAPLRLLQLRGLTFAPRTDSRSIAPSFPPGSHSATSSRCTPLGCSRGWRDLASGFGLSSWLCCSSPRALPRDRSEASLKAGPCSSV